MKGNLTFDTIPIKFCAMVEQYRLELAKKSWIDLQLDVSLPWKTICWIHETVLISKKFEFIKRLVDHDNINFNKVYEKEKAEKIDICIYWRYWKEENTYWLLMLLSIQEKPIEFLVSILK